MNIKPLNIHNKFTFLFLGTWKSRKGYDQLFEAFYSEFSDKDNVQLVVKTDKPKAAEQFAINKRKKMGINKGFAPILFESKVFNEIELPKFIKSAHCLVMPTKGEGFGYPGLQSMSLGVPVIITNFSGCQDYANEETATLLEPSGFLFHKNMDGIPQFRNKKWAFIEVANIRKSMRYVLNNPQRVKEKAETAYSYVMERFNYTIIEELFTKMIREIYG
jgi:glycosyltransferase involved in cell wall biosynthesis